MNVGQLTILIKNRATELGFSGCGIAAATALDEEAVFLKNWLNQQHHGKMGYLENHFEKRTDPRLLVEGAKSVISLSYNYYTEAKQVEGAPRIARYAFGKDYHTVIRNKLEQLLEYIRTLAAAPNARCFVDSAPVLERAWAQRSGLGWIGKNTLLLTKRAGSYFFLSEIILDLELEYDSPVKDYCGNCTKCLDACPTNALHTPYQMDGSKCISYFTIELKDAILPESEKGKFQNWMFGCDICQEVCPINSQAREHQEPDFLPKKEILETDRQGWENLTETQFREWFADSAIKRTKFSGLKRNIDFLKE
ncbi:MAG: tRNA epoxyqueuosine(34) reductase QueG [Chitinophagales bacterium]